MHPTPSHSNPLSNGLARWALAGAIAALGTACSTAPPSPVGYPTLDRVRYVQECVRDHPGPSYEMTDKCVCAIDRMAERVTYDDYMEMITATNANSIGGERGSYIRDAAALQDDIKRYRTLQGEVQRACFLKAGAG